MKTIYRSKSTQEDKLPRDARVIYYEDWLLAAGFTFLAVFVGAFFLVYVSAEAVSHPFAVWSDSLKVYVRNSCLGLAMLCAYLAASSLKPRKVRRQTRGAVLHEDAEIGGDGFKAVKAFLDDEFKAQPGKAPPLAFLAPKGVDILKVKAAPASTTRKAAAATTASGKSNPFLLCAPISDDRSRTHMLIVGGSGSGKSLTMKPVLHQAIAAGHKLVILDKKGEYTEEIDESRMALFGQHDARQYQWAIATDLRTEPDIEQFIDGVVPLNDKDPFWGNATRRVASALLVHLHKKNPGRWTLYDYAQLTKLPPAELAVIALAAYPAAAPILQGEGQALSSVMSNMATFTAPLIKFGEMWEGSGYPLFSFSEWLEDPAPLKNCLIFQSGGKYSSLNDPLIRGYLNFISGYVDSPMYPRDSEEKPRSIWFFCDEFQSFGKLDTLARNILERGRDKGLRMCIGVQDVSQLREVYGDDFVKFLMSNVGITVLAGANQGDTAETFSKNIGQLSFVKTHTSKSGGGTTVNDQEHQEEVITTSEIIGKLGFKAGVTRALYRFTRSPDAYIVYQPLIKYPRVTKPNVPADWVLGKVKLPAEQISLERAAGATAGGVQETPKAAQPVRPPAWIDVPQPSVYQRYEDLPDDLADIEEFQEAEHLQQAMEAREAQEAYELELWMRERSQESPDIDPLAPTVSSIVGAPAIETVLSLIDSVSSEVKPRSLAENSAALSKLKNRLTH